MGNGQSTIVTPTFFLLVLIGVVIVAAIVTWLVNPHTYENSRTYVFISVLTGLGLFIVFLSYYSLVEIQQKQQRLTAIQETARITDDVYSGLLRDMQDNSTVIPNFLLSLFPLLPIPESPAVDENTPRALISKMSISNRIFNLWSDIITANLFLDVHPVAYLTQFLQYAHSQPLYQQWQLYGINYDERTRRFAELLFAYNRTHDPRTANDYVRLAEMLYQDPTYQAIVKGK